MNTNDVFLLVRLCKENQHGQVLSTLTHGEGAASSRLERADYIYTDGFGHWCPSRKGFAAMETFVRYLRKS